MGHAKDRHSVELSRALIHNIRAAFCVTEMAYMCSAPKRPALAARSSSHSRAWWFLRPCQSSLSAGTPALAVMLGQGKCFADAQRISCPVLLFGLLVCLLFLNGLY